MDNPCCERHDYPMPFFPCLGRRECAKCILESFGHRCSKTDTTRDHTYDVMLGPLPGRNGPRETQAERMGR